MPSAAASDYLKSRAPRCWRSSPRATRSSLTAGKRAAFEQPDSPTPGSGCNSLPFATARLFAFAGCTWTQRETVIVAHSWRDGRRNSPAFEELHSALVLFGGGARPERAEVPALARLRIDFARIEPILA